MPLRRPTQRVSGCSWSKASVASAPAISKAIRFLRPEETWLITTDPDTPPTVRNRTSAMSSVVTTLQLADAVTVGLEGVRTLCPTAARGSP